MNTYEDEVLQFVVSVVAHLPAGVNLTARPLGPDMIQLTITLQSQLTLSSLFIRQSRDPATPMHIAREMVRGMENFIREKIHG